MEEKKQGGKRRGAGRKPILNKKELVSLYVEKNKILKFGNTEKLKGKLYTFIDEFGSEVKVVNTAPEYFDAPKMDKITHDEPKQWQEPEKPLLPSEQFFLKAEEAKSRAELEKVLLQAKKELSFFAYQRLVEATKHLFEKFFND